MKKIMKEINLKLDKKLKNIDKNKLLYKIELNIINKKFYNNIKTNFYEKENKKSSENSLF